MKKLLFGLTFLLSTLAYSKTAYQVYRMPSTGNIPAWGSIDLGQSAARTGTLPLGNGGTGITSCSNKNYPYSDGTTLVCDNSLRRESSTTLIAPNYISMGGSFGSGNSLLGGYSSNSLSVADGANLSTSNYPIVTSWSNSNQTTPASALVIVRGQVAANGTINLGEGFSVTTHNTGDYTLTFDTTFSSTPVVTVSGVNATSSVVASIHSTTTSTVRVFTVLTTAGGSLADEVFNFIAIGRR